MKRSKQTKRSARHAQRGNDDQAAQSDESARDEALRDPRSRETRSPTARSNIESKPESGADPDSWSPTVEECFAPNAGRTRLRQLNRRLAGGDGVSARNSADDGDAGT